MSQRDVEGLLGRMVTDQSFRWRFYKDPVGACVAEAMEVTSRELEAVLTLHETQIAAFAQQLDPRIVRAALGGEGLSPGAATDAGSELGTRAKQHRVR